MELTKERLQRLLENCIAYIVEIHSKDESYLRRFWTEVIGMTEKEMEYYEVMGE